MIRGDTAGAEAGAVAPSGDRLANLYRWHAPAAIRLAYLITGDRGLAEDLVQDAFVRLSGRLVHLRDPGRFDAYLSRTVVNLANAHFRRKKLEHRYAERQRTAAAESEPDVVTRETLRAALLMLPVRQRTAIVLRYYEDLPEWQIADVLGCRPATVRSLVARGMERLRPLIGGA